MTFLKGSSLRWQVSLLISAVMLGVAGTFGVAVTFEQSRKSRSEFEVQMMAIARGLAAGSADPIVREDFAGLEVLALRTAEYPEIRHIQVIDLKGRTLSAVSVNMNGLPVPTFEKIEYLPPSTFESSVRYEEKGRNDLLEWLNITRGNAGILWYPISVGEPVGWVRLTFSLHSIEQAITRGIKSTLLMALAGVTIGSWLLLRILSKFMGSVESAAVFARRLTEMTGEQKDVNSSSSEIGDLDRALNSVSSQLHLQRMELEEQKNSLRDLAENLKVAVTRAESANIAKSQFLATMSHELRTPMNGILGMAQMLLVDDIDESTRHDFARTILNSGQTLLTLLNDILDLSKIEAGKLELEKSAVDPAQILHETMNLFREVASEKGVELKAQWEGETQLYMSDPHRLRQMLSNLTNNAIKFTNAGKVSLWAKEVEQCNGHALLEFSVTDTGVGIDEEKQELLFKPFSQADTSITREYGGTGLGLSIVRNLAIRMGGDVGVESTQGQGACFWFRVRAEVLGVRTERRMVERSEDNDLGADRTRNRLVLVIEDNPINQKVIRTFLGRLGLDHRVASDGAAGLKAVTNGEIFDLILMDVQMPIMDGYEATRRIRDWEAVSNKPRHPIVALTADAFDEDRRRCFEAGMDDFVSKPISFDQLKLTIRNWIKVS